MKKRSSLYPLRFVAIFILLFSPIAVAGDGSLYGCVVGHNGCEESFPVIEDVGGWQDLKWGDSLDSIKKKYKERVYQRANNAPYLLKGIRISGLDFEDVALSLDEKNHLDGLILFYNSDKDDLIALKEIIAKLAVKYGRPTVVTGNLELGEFANATIVEDELVRAAKISIKWSFPSTSISAEASYIRKLKSPYALDDRGSFGSQISIFYERIEQGDDL